jgi:hypothetical protein
MSRPLAGLSFSLSGFVNPERADLRLAGTDLGAKYHPEWTPTTTHLICAMAGTPKAVQVGMPTMLQHSPTLKMAVDLIPARCRFNKRKQPHKSLQSSGFRLAWPVGKERMRRIFL